MNLVIDETVEEVKDGTRNNIGMVVSNYTYKQINLVNSNHNVTFFLKVVRGNSIIMLEALERIM